LFLGQQLLEGKQEFSGAWNFGPPDEGHRDVLSVVKELQSHWSRIDFQIATDERNPHEANLLKLDCSKAHTKLDWRPVWNSSRAFAKTAQWYRGFYESGRVLSQEQLAEYINDAKQKQMSWVM
jgi:CDP-glucose 4,6-dehydratase